MCVFSVSELALYKLKLKQEGARRPASSAQAANQVWLSHLVTYTPLPYFSET